jgi:hypothetical protein
LYQDGTPHYQFGTVSSLYDENATTTNMRDDTFHGMKAKGSALTVKVRDIIMSIAQQGEASANINLNKALSAIMLRFLSSLGAKTLEEASFTVANDFRIMDRVIYQLNSTVPDHPPASTSSYIPHDSRIAELALIQTVCRSTLMQLHGIFAEHSTESHKKVINAAYEIVAIARELEKTEEIYWQVPINVRISSSFFASRSLDVVRNAYSEPDFTQMGWGNACEVFHQEISRILKNVLSPNANHPSPEIAVRKLREDMEFLASMTRRLTKVYCHTGTCLFGWQASVAHSFSRLLPKSNRRLIGQGATLDFLS